MDQGGYDVRPAGLKGITCVSCFSCAYRRTVCTCRGIFFASLHGVTNICTYFAYILPAQEFCCQCVAFFFVHGMVKFGKLEKVFVGSKNIELFFTIFGQSIFKVCLLLQKSFFFEGSTITTPHRKHKGDGTPLIIIFPFIHPSFFSYPGRSLSQPMLCRVNGCHLQSFHHASSATPRTSQYYIKCCIGVSCLLNGFQTALPCSYCFHCDAMIAVYDMSHDTTKDVSLKVRHRQFFIVWSWRRAREIPQGKDVLKEIDQ